MVRPIKQDEEPKKKDLASILKELEKKGCPVHRMGDLESSAALGSISVIPSGSILLDSAMGVGGYPRGRIVEIAGKESSGKSTLALLAAAQAQQLGDKVAYIDVEHCVPINTKLFDFKSNTLKSIQDFSAGDEVLSYDQDGRRFVVKTVAAVHDNGTRDVFSVKTKRGGDLRLTGNHKVFTKRGWIPVSDLMNSDELATPTSINIPEEATELTKDQAVFVGYHLGDGHAPKRGSWSFANADRTIIEHVKRIARLHHCELKYVRGCNWVLSKAKFTCTDSCVFCGKKLTATMPSQRRLFCSTRCANEYNNPRKVKQGYSKLKKQKGLPVATALMLLLDRLELRGVIREKRKIPKEIMFAAKDVKAACLRGIFSTDGQIDKCGAIRLSNVSEVLIEQVKILLLQFGILSYVRDGKRTEGGRTHRWRVLSIYGYDDRRRFYEAIGFVGKKQDRLSLWVKKSKRLRSDREMCEDKTRPIYWDTVVSKVAVGKTRVFDLSVEETHCFVLGDFLVHNSYSSEWAKKLGVNSDEILLQQPDYGEQALDTVNALVESGEIGMVIIDSTAALIPKEELEATLEQNFMGLQARMMSKALRKLTQTIGKSRAVVIFINQIREKIGVMFGSPETTPGGNALKFYSSIRLGVTALTGKDYVYSDEAGDRIGHRLRIKVVKNKVAVPFRSCEFDLYFASGVDSVGEVVDAAIQHEIVSTNGRTYSYGDSRWVGHAAYVQAVREDKKLFNQLRTAVTQCLYKS